MGDAIRQLSSSPGSVAALDCRVVTDGLEFPEGPVALVDGSVLVVEIRGRKLTRVAPDGTKRTVSNLAGGPNGAAIGPDGRCYICNNGGLGFSKVGDLLLPGLAPDDYSGGWIEAVDLTSGRSEVLYRDCGDFQLRAPNDLVFDADGGFWFTDSGKMFPKSRDRGAVYYAKADGSSIRRVIFPLDGNGIGLSPDNSTLYVAETHNARLWAYEIEARGRIRRVKGPVPWERGHLLAASPDYALFDSLAVDAGGYIWVADIPHGLSVFAPDGTLAARHGTGEMFTTNICFGGPGLKTAYATLSTLGQLVAFEAPRAGVPLHFLNEGAAGKAKT